MTYQIGMPTGAEEPKDRARPSLVPELACTDIHSGLPALQFDAAIGPKNMAALLSLYGLQGIDIDGETIVRAVRLESYSKLLNKMVDHDSSFLVIAPELFDSANNATGTKVWLTNTPALAVRDYPNIKSVMFRRWKHNRTRTQRSAA